MLQLSDLIKPDEKSQWSARITIWVAINWNKSWGSTWAFGTNIIANFLGLDKPAYPCGFARPQQCMAAQIPKVLM